MTNFEQEMAKLPTYSVEHLERDAVLAELTETANKLFMSTSFGTILEFSDAQRKVGYLIGEIASADRKAGEELRGIACTTSDRVFNLLGGEEKLQVEPPEGQEASLRWAIRVRHVEVFQKKLAA